MALESRHQPPRRRTTIFHVVLPSRPPRPLRVAAQGAAERLAPVGGRAAHLFVALSVLVPVALVALTTYLVLKIFVIGTD